LGIVCDLYWVSRDYEEDSNHGAESSACDRRTCGYADEGISHRLVGDGLTCLLHDHLGRRLCAVIFDKCKSGMAVDNKVSGKGTMTIISR